MKALAPLIVAVVSGSLAVAIVAVDLQFNVESALEYRDGGAWKEAGDGRELRPFGGECATQDLRLTVRNGALFAKELDVHITHWDASLQRDRVVESGTWSLDRGEERLLEFRVDDSAFPEPHGEPPAPGEPVKLGAYPDRLVWVSVSVDTWYANVCVAPPEGST